jgi:NAD(P)-dependent dehydrogenase (short-subunit alcohol dehydrogenase family)
VALVTGAGGHLGSAIAKGLGALGASVVLNGRNLKSLETVRSEILAFGGEAVCSAGDVSDAAACARVADEASTWKSRLDILVHAAYAARDISLEDATSADYLRAVALSAGALHDLVKQALPALERSASLREGGSSIIAIGSMYGMVSPDPSIYGSPTDINPPFYGAAKAGLLQFTRWLACNLGPRGIRVNCVTPGAFPKPAVKEAAPNGTGFKLDAPFDTAPEFHDKLCRKNPLGRIGQPDELSGAVCFLAGRASSYVTGSNLVVDGGWTAW